MTSVKKSPKSNGKRKKAVSRTYSSGKIKNYFNLRREFPTMTKTECLMEAGYSENTKPDTIEGTQLFKKLWREHEELCRSLDLDVATRIREAQKATGASVKGALSVMQEILAKPKAKDRDRVSAGKEIVTITGERMPEQIDHNITGDEELLSKIMSN